jgi:hypothetical protein
MNGPIQDVGITSDPPGATVYIDGDSLGTTPEIPILKKSNGWPTGNIVFSLFGLIGLAADLQSGGGNDLTPQWMMVGLADGSVVYDFDKSMWIPPLNRNRIWGEILAGAGIGFIGGKAIENTGYGGNMAGIVILGVGVPIGSAIGVTIVGSIGNEKGSFNRALAGSYLGIFAGALTTAFMNRGEEPNYTLNQFIIYTCSAIGATIGFNSTRRYKTPPAETETGILNFNEGQMSLAAPRMYFRPNPFVRADLVQTIDLVSMRF